MRILVLNAGSSSIKLRLLDANDAVELSLDLGTEGLRIPGALEEAVGELEIEAVGHRVVHGGSSFSSAEVITDEVQEQIASLKELAPLHQAASLEGIRRSRRAFPDVPHVACFDTAFHSDMPAASSTYAVPLQWRERFGVRRYGFHGLSHAYASRRAAEMIGESLDSLRIVTGHLGAGASLAAVAGGRSVDTSMGFTPLEGLVMATRSGSIDPSVPLWLQAHGGLTPAEIQEALEHESGLAGLAGTADMRAVLKRATNGEAEAILARDVYVHALRAGIARMVASMGGVDAVVFTGGVGEHSSEIRSLAAAGLEFLGIRLDEPRNRRAAGDMDISPDGASVRVLVVEAREDLRIASEIRALLQDDG
ncbi:MAG TPA: acetate/propionate family kinase [Actinomycetota bacterium]|nr:acetate/propionate family kinase [Actinomycetota bacterium]